MIVNNVIGRISDPQFSGAEIDYLDIEWYNCQKKINRLFTQKGTEIGLRLDEHTATHGLKQDDVLAQTETGIIAVNILPAECLVINIEDTNILPKFCYEIGNRHAPFFNGEKPNQFVIPYDKTIQIMIEKLNIKTEIKDVKLDLDKSISSTPGHSHGHSH